MDLFSSEAETSPTESWLEKNLAELELDNLTPVQALVKLSEWKERAKRLEN